jgi:hypothetical protein
MNCYVPPIAQHIELNENKIDKNKMSTVNDDVPAASNTSASTSSSSTSSVAVLITTKSAVEVENGEETKNKTTTVIMTEMKSSSISNSSTSHDDENDEGVPSKVERSDPQQQKQQLLLLLQVKDDITTPPTSNVDIHHDTFVTSTNHSSEDGKLKSCLRKSTPSSDQIIQYQRKTSSKRRRVSFSIVSIRRYGMILGNNPACPCGPPVTLGWEYDELPQMNITEFESFRLRSRRFRTSHLILSHYRRLEILQSVGYTAEEIAAVEKEMAKIQRQRNVTRTCSPCRGIEHAFQSLGRKIGKAVLCRSRKQ